MIIEISQPQFKGSYLDEAHKEYDAYSHIVVSVLSEVLLKSGTLLHFEAFTMPVILIEMLPTYVLYR